VDEIGIECSTSGARKGLHVEYWCESQKEGDHSEDLDVSVWIILRWILERYDVAVWAKLIWLRIGTSGGLL
jgi:hypothetical protein